MNTDTHSPRRILSARKREMLRRELALCQRDINGGIGTPAPRGKEANDSPMPERMRKRLEGNFYNVATDPGAIARARAINRELAKASPDTLTDTQRNALEAIRRDFEEWAPKNMMPSKMNKLKSKDDGFDAAVKAAVFEHSPEFTRRSADYVNAMRQLDPDNESAGNIERLRPN